MLLGYGSLAIFIPSASAYSDTQPKAGVTSGLIIITKTADTKIERPRFSAQTKLRDLAIELRV